jgi:hypothetical protein
VNAIAAPWFRAAVNRSLWATWPDAEPVFGPIHEKARREGHAHQLAFFNGALFEVDAVMSGDLLTVTFAEVDHMDLTTLASVVASLLRMKDLVDRANAPVPPRPPRRLQAVL